MADDFVMRDRPRWPIRLDPEEIIVGRMKQADRAAFAQPDDDEMSLLERLYADIVRGVAFDDSRAGRLLGRERWDRAASWVADVHAQGGVIDWGVMFGYSDPW